MLKINTHAVFARHVVPKQSRNIKLFLGGFLLCFLTGCVGTLWTGAGLVYDRHSVYKKMHDYDLAAQAHHLIFKDNYFRCDACMVDVAAYHRYLLVAGHVPTYFMKATLLYRLNKLPSGYRIYNKVIVAKMPSQFMQDAWITAKIRSNVLADADIDPNAFKVITVDGVVYLMGEMKRDQAAALLRIARQVEGVRSVVKLFRYYRLE